MPRYLTIITSLILGFVVVACSDNHENDSFSSESLTERSNDELSLSQQASNEKMNENSDPLSESISQNEFEENLNQLMKNMKYSGAVLITKDDQVIISKGYGTADFTNDRPNAPHTVYQIGSLTRHLLQQPFYSCKRLVNWTSMTQ